MIRTRQSSGFTLVELIIVVAIIAIISAIAVPKLLGARLPANEAAAISTLRLLCTAEEQVRSHSAIDTDSDGAGEFAYCAELAGTVPLRISVGGVPGPGAAPTDNLIPSDLTAAFGVVNAQSLVMRSGYCFQIWLPGTPAGGLTPGIAELPTIGGSDPANFPDSQRAEVLWCCYAWPVAAHQTGNRAFFINQDGALTQYHMSGPAPYSGTTKMPAFDEAFVTLGDMGSNVRVGVAGGHDASTWTPVQ